MGLDMYLRAKRTVTGTTPYALSDMVENIGCDYEWATLAISVDVGYWRKCWLIHNWFVDTVQNGHDDCGEYWITKDTLHELYMACWKIKLGTENTLYESGLRFDDSDFYTFDLCDQIDRTIDVLENVLKLDTNVWDLYYSSSW